MGAYKRKTYDEFDLVYDYGYGYGPETICTYSSLSEAKQGKKEYIENEGIWPVIVKRRVKIGEI